MITPPTARLRVSIPVVDEALAQAALTRKGSKQDLTDDRLSTDRRAGDPYFTASMDLL